MDLKRVDVLGVVSAVEPVTEFGGKADGADGGLRRRQVVEVHWSLDTAFRTALSASTLSPGLPRPT